MIYNCIPPTPCAPWTWDPELECLREQLRRAQIEAEKARIRREIDRLSPYRPHTWSIPPVVFQPCIPLPAAPLTIHDVLRRIPGK